MKSISYFILLLVSTLCCVACRVNRPPAAPYSAYQVPAPPDYTDPAYWSSLPTLKDSADGVPPGIKPGLQHEHEVDVFFVHPTTFDKGKAWNANLGDSALNLVTDQYAIRHQASIFNAAGRIYAPRYRQLNLGGFYSPDTTSMKRGVSLAYQDVRTAFMHYLERWNEGRPIIMAGHSQGARHVQALLKEFFDGKALQDQLVAAYAPGWPFAAEMFEHIPVCENPSQTACIAGWASWREGTKPKEYDPWYTNASVVNPVSWQIDTLPNAPEDHQVFLGRKFEKLVERPLTARIHGGILWVSRPIPFLPQKNYHIGDFNLFWVNVRENAVLRSQTFLARARR